MSKNEHRNEHRDEMRYSGFMHGPDAPESGYVARNSSHYRVNDSLRKSQLKGIGLEEADYDDVDCDVEDAQNAQRDIKRQRRKRLAVLFGAMFVLSIVIGLIIYSFMGRFNETLAPLGLLGALLIAAAVGAVLFIVPMIIMLCFK